MADEGSPSAEDAPVTFHVKSSSEARYTLTVPRSMTVLDLKKKLAAEEYSNVPAERQRLIYSGRVLKDPELLATYSIKDGNTMHLVKSALSNQAPGGASSSAAASSGGRSGSGGAPQAPANLATGPGNNPLAGLTGARYAGLAQLPGAQMFGPDGGMGAPPSPERMAEMLSDPQFASTMNEALSNPAVIDMLMNQSPLRDMGPIARQMLGSEQFRRMMTDPNTLREMNLMRRTLHEGYGGGNPDAFPAPGITDTTPPNAAGTGGPGAPPTTRTNILGGTLPITDAQLRRFGTDTAGSDPAPPNPLAALFNAAGAAPSATPPPTGSTATPPAGTDQQRQTPPFSPFNTGGAPNAQTLSLLSTLLGLNNADGSNSDANDGNDGGPGQGQTNTGAQPSGPTFPFLFPGGLPMPGGVGGGAGGADAGSRSAAGSASIPTATMGDSRPPEERYEAQLRQLNEMGFYDFDRNVEALRRTGGNVNGAVEYLLTH